MQKVREIDVDHACTWHVPSKGWRHTQKGERTQSKIFLKIKIIVWQYWSLFTGFVFCDMDFVYRICLSWHGLCLQDLSFVTWDLFTAFLFSGMDFVYSICLFWHGLCLQYLSFLAWTLFTGFVFCDMDLVYRICLMIWTWFTGFVFCGMDFVFCDMDFVYRICLFWYGIWKDLSFLAWTLF